MSADNSLTEAFREHLRTPELSLRLSINLWNGAPLLYLEGPGPTVRSKRRQLGPVIVADEGETPGELIARIGAAIDWARSTT